MRRFRYYIHPPMDISSRHLLLVPVTQVHGLIDEINKCFRCHYRLPSDVNLGLVLPFEKDGSPQPRFLGRCTSRDMKDQLEMSIPAPQLARDRSDDDRSWEAFCMKIEAGVAATKKKSSAIKAKRRVEQVMRHQDWCRSLRRAQCYLGLRPRRPRDLPEPELDEQATAEDRQKAEWEYGLACGTILLPLDVRQPVPFSFASEPIFVCVDVEANERCQDEITEVGISTLDTLDLAGLAPGEGGDAWISQIRSRHFRIRESAHVVNQDFVSGCPDRFEFGESEWVWLRDAAKMTEECFQPPYSAHIPVAAQQRSSQGTVPATHPPDGFPEYKRRVRNVILLGHDPRADIKHLRRLGSKLFDVPTETGPSNNPSIGAATSQPDFLDVLDTACLFRVLKRDTAFRSLGQILVDVGLLGWNLHNAGNDARYTLESMIRIVLNSRLLLDVGPQVKGERSSDWPLGLPPVEMERPNPDVQAQDLAKSHALAWEEEVERRVAESVADSEARIRAECNNWAVATGWKGDNWDRFEDVDGGDGKGIHSVL
jgi:hypothetical protein